jgi:hypothetical protein
MLHHRGADEENHGGGKRQNRRSEWVASADVLADKPKSPATGKLNRCSDDGGSYRNCGADEANAS